MSEGASFYAGQTSSKSNVSDDELWLRFIRDRRWSLKQKRQFLGIEKSPNLPLNSEQIDLRQLLASALKQKSVDQGLIFQDLQWLNAPHQHLISYFDERYPPLLKQISDPPIALFAKGDLSLLKSPKVAIVGSRMPTPMGQKVAQEVAATVSASGVSVISGLALGIDGVAHSSALNELGSSIAVVGNGLDIVYPSRQKHLYQHMLLHGLVLSEYPLGQSPTRFSFPQRNRIISGLSHGVVIIEAAEKSGTLITARLSIEQNRELMVVPGAALSSQYAGSHRLLKDGAGLVCCGRDVLSQLSGSLQEYCLKDTPIESCENSPELSQTQRLVFELLSSESTNVDTLIEKSSLTAAEVSAILLELELVGVATTTREGGYVRTV